MKTDHMKTVVLLISLIALTASSQTASSQTVPRTRDDGASVEKQCRDMVGKEATEGEGRSHIGAFQARRFGECLMGRPQ